MDIELIGKTIKGKNKIREKGKFASIKQETQTVYFSAREGPWIYIIPHNRWIHKIDDNDFIVKNLGI